VKAPLSSWLGSEIPKLRPKVDPRSTGGPELPLKVLSRRLKGRTHHFTNWQRLNRYLLLQQLNLNRQAETLTYRRLITEWLTTRDGLAAQRRLVADRCGRPSLR
jgi:hypothetical protein